MNAKVVKSDAINLKTTFVFGWFIYSFGMAVYACDGIFPLVIHALLGPFVVGIAIITAGLSAKMIGLAEFIGRSKTSGRLLCCVLIIVGILFLIFGHKLEILSDNTLVNPGESASSLRPQFAVAAFISVITGMLFFPNKTTSAG